MTTNSSGNLPTGVLNTVVLGQGVGTAPAFSTATYPATTTINQLLYSSAANTVSGLTTGNNGVLITSAGGVPSISSTLPSAVQGNITAVGTIASGVWNGTAIDVAHGGTGDTTLTAYAVLTGGTTTTNPVQSIASVGTLGQVLTSNGAGALPSFQNLGAIALAVNDLSNFRLTLTTGVPITTADVLAATTIYWTPYRGNYVSLYNTGSAIWANFTSAELSIAVPATTATVYDVYVGLSGGVPALSLIAWTNITTRATALALQNGVLVSSGNAALRYVGSFATTGVSGQTEDSSANRLVWNYYNRVFKQQTITYTGGNYTYSTATWRQTNGSTTYQVKNVIGYSEDIVKFVSTSFTVNATTGAYVATGVGLNSTTTNSANTFGGFNPTSSSPVFPNIGTYGGFLAVGLNTIAWLEIGGGVGTTTWSGTATNTNITPGMLGEIFC